MNNYILKQDDITSHFFYIPNQGIAQRIKQLHLWQNHRIILKNSTDVFSVFKDDTDTSVNIISITDKNELKFTILKEGAEKSFILTTLKEEMNVKNIKLFKTPIGLNIIYAATYQGRLLLIHCVLGNNAKPDTIDEILNEDFSIHKNSVYYTNSKGILGYKNLSDGRADIFNSITPNATSPYLLNCLGKDYLVYIKDKKIYLQNRPVIDDPLAKNPIILENGGLLFIMWQSGDFLRFISSIDKGETFTPSMQYVSSGKIPALIHVINQSSTFLYYATISPKDIKIFGKDDCFENPIKTLPPSAENATLSRFKILLDMEKREVIKLKKEILLLSNAINELKKNNPQKPDKF